MKQLKVNELKGSINEVIRFLVEGKFHEIELMTRKVRLSAQEIKKAIDDYGKTLTVLPENAFGLVDVKEIKNSTPKQWSVIVPLWTKEEGLSDLTLEMTLIKSDRNFKIELDNIHVL